MAVAVTGALGIDLSLTSSGAAWDDGQTRLIPPKLAPHAVLSAKLDRLQWIKDTVSALVATHNPALVVIEGFSYGSQGRAIYEIGGAGYIVRLAIHNALRDIVEVAPSTVKKFATDKGNADKDAVLAAAIRDGYPGSSNDEADAWWLWRIGRVLLGESSCNAARRAVIVSSFPQVSAAA